MITSGLMAFRHHT